MSLIMLSAFFYLIHYAIFHDAHHIFLFLIGDIAFIPIEVLLVTLVIHRLLEAREKRATLKKMNMVIGTFFTEVGTSLLKSLSAFELQPDSIQKELMLTTQWADKDFVSLIRRIKDYQCSTDSRKGDLECLKDFLVRERRYLHLFSLATRTNPFNANASVEIK